MKMTDAEVGLHWTGLKKKQRGEVAEAVVAYCKGRSASETGRLLGHDHTWVKEHLQYFAVADASGRRAAPRANGLTRDAVRGVVKRHGPEKPDSNYVSDYEAEDHTKEVAQCLASAYEAAEVALDKGTIKEAKEKGDDRVGKLISADRGNWSAKLARVASTVRHAAQVLDNAKVSDLRKAETRKAIAKAHAAWMVQMERIENFHDSFNHEVSGHNS